MYSRNIHLNSWNDVPGYAFRDFLSSCIQLRRGASSHRHPPPGNLWPVSGKLNSWRDERKSLLRIIVGVIMLVMGIIILVQAFL